MSFEHGVFNPSGGSLSDVDGDLIHHGNLLAADFYQIKQILPACYFPWHVSYSSTSLLFLFVFLVMLFSNPDRFCS